MGRFSLAELPVGWLITSRLAGSPLLRAAIDASPAWRETVFRRVGELARQLHSTRVPPQLLEGGTWVSRQLAQARKNLSWCDGAVAGLAELERSQPAPCPETLIHGDLALDNVLVDEYGALHLIDWAGGGSGDPRHDVALALNTKPELELSVEVFDAFYAGYRGAALDDNTREWFVRLYDYF
jgi:aminoglycoside phosphotransferase (APT) family kinase protein